MVAPVDTALLVCIFMLQLLTAVKVLVVLAQSLLFVQIPDTCSVFVLIVGRTAQLTSCQTCLLKVRVENLECANQIDGRQSSVHMDWAIGMAGDKQEGDWKVSLPAMPIVDQSAAGAGQKHVRNFSPPGKWGSLDCMSALPFLLFVCCSTCSQWQTRRLFVSSWTSSDNELVDSACHDTLPLPIPQKACGALDPPMKLSQHIPAICPNCNPLYLAEYVSTFVRMFMSTWGSREAK